MDEAPHKELVRQISAAWEHAKRELEQLRQSVREHEELAQAKSQRDGLNLEKDAALKRLGQGVMELVRKGKWSVPPSLAGAVKSAEQAQQRLEAQASAISDLLDEGTDAAARKFKKEKSAVAQRTKKR